MAVLKWDDYRGIFDSIRHIGVMEIRGLSDVECYTKYWKDDNVAIEQMLDDGKSTVEYEIVPRDKMVVAYSLKVLKVYKCNITFLPSYLREQVEDKKRITLGIEIQDLKRAVNVIQLLNARAIIDDLEELLKNIVVYKPKDKFAPFVVRVEGVYSYFAFISPKLL